MMIEKQIEVNGAEINYASEGNGFPLLFIHGFCEDQTAWSGFIEPFINTCRVILPDLPGFGESSLPAENTSITFYADCIKAILDEEKISECVMVGHSLGGYITLNFAARFPGPLKAFGLFH